MACTTPTEFNGTIDFSQEWPGADIQRVWPSTGGTSAYAIDQTMNGWHITGALCLGRDADSAIPLHLAYALSGKDTDQGNHSFTYGTSDRPETYPVTGNDEHSYVIPTGGLFGNYVRVTIKIFNYETPENGAAVSFDFSIAIKPILSLKDKGEGTANCIHISGTW